MGIFYYLFKKLDFEKERHYPVSLGIEEKERLMELSNGWVLHDTYYKSIEEVKKNYSQKILIGELCDFFRFMLCIYPSENLKYKNHEFRHEYYLDKEVSSLDDWITLFNDPDNYIKDEDGNRITPEEMVELITLDNPKAISKERLEFLLGDFTASVHKKGKLEINSILNLPQYKINGSKIMPPGFAYDILFSGNGNDTGAILSKHWL